MKPARRNLQGQCWLQPHPRIQWKGRLQLPLWQRGGMVSVTKWSRLVSDSGIVCSGIRKSAQLWFGIVDSTETMDMGHTRELLSFYLFGMVTQNCWLSNSYVTSLTGKHVGTKVNKSNQIKKEQKQDKQDKSSLDPRRIRSKINKDKSSLVPRRLYNWVGVMSEWEKPKRDLCCK